MPSDALDPPLALIAVLVLAGCAHDLPAPPPIVVQGNGHCTPSPDLPTHMTMKKLPAVKSFMEDIYGFLGVERHDHAADQAKYNSLYDTCVNGKIVPAAK